MDTSFELSDRADVAMRRISSVSLIRTRFRIVTVTVGRVPGVFGGRTVECLLICRSRRYGRSRYAREAQPRANRHIGIVREIKWNFFNRMISSATSCWTAYTTRRSAFWPTHPRATMQQLCCSAITVPRLFCDSTMDADATFRWVNAEVEND